MCELRVWGTSVMLEASSLSSLAGIRHGFFTRDGGVSSGIYASLNGEVGSSDAPDQVAENRARMAATLGVAPDRLLTCYQVHSPDVVIAEVPWSRDARPHADAIVTRVAAACVGSSTADCGPVLFADPQARVVGAAHAGWRGALSGVLGGHACGDGRARGQARAHRRGARADDQSVELRGRPRPGQRFLAADPGNAHSSSVDARAARFVRSSRLYRDTPAARGHRAFDGLELCTYADPARFFSYRRATHRGEPDYGRHVNAIALARLISR